jgi:phage portal protein BeeE
MGRFTFDFSRGLALKGDELAMEERNDPLSIDDWLTWVSFMGTSYPLGLNTTLRGNEERIAPSYTGHVTGALGADAVVFACCAVRLRVFTEARFAFQRMRKGRPGDLFSDPSLNLLERPWPGGTTGDLLAKSLISADFAGNAFVAWLSPRRLQVLRPDWMTIVSGIPDVKESNGWDLGAEVLGYLYQPGGTAGGKDPIPLLPNRVAHFAPMPDPLAPWRGRSWISPVIREIEGDLAATTHKLKFFEGGATPNLLVKSDPQITPEKFKEWVKLFKEMHPEGLQGAYQRIFLGGGADATVIGANLRQVDFKQTQGAGETRIAAAAGVPPVLVGLSEGLQAATYSNYGQARRAFADEWARPTWRNFAGSLQNIISTPSDARLWYDDRDIPFLQEDQKDAAEILSVRASTVKSLVDAGFESESVVAAVDANDLSLLKHTGLFSVQLQPPGGELPAPSGNGKVPADAAVS